MHYLQLKKTRFIVIIAALSVLLCGCAGLIRTEQGAASDSVPLFANSTVGQTFVAKYDGLAGIFFHLSPDEVPADGTIQLHLRSDPGSAVDLAVSTNALSTEQILMSNYYVFKIPPQANSRGKYYYAFLEITGNGIVQVSKGLNDSYLNGSLYQNGLPVDGQSTFQLSYSRRMAFPGLALEAVSWAGILLAAFFLFVLPGWGLLAWLWPGWDRLSWPEKLGASVGLSVALYPVLFLWTNIIHVHLGAFYAWLPPLGGLALLLWRNRQRIKDRDFFKPARIHFSAADIVLLILLALVVFSRFWVIRALDAPLWADSIHHTMISQLLVDHGGLFNSWEPYTDLQTLTYHFGFHANVAVFHWVSQMDVPHSVLWMGQIMNILAVIVVCPLAIKLGRSRWAGVGAILLAGLLSPMPISYTNWGRFTQLAGQVILPVAVYLIWEILEKSSALTSVGSASSNLKGWFTRHRPLLPAFALVCLSLAGLALSHYRIIILAVLFVLIYFVISLTKTGWRDPFISTFVIGLGAGVLFLPWFIHVFAGRIMQVFGLFMKTPVASAATWIQEYNGTGDMTRYLSPILWWLMAMIVGLGLWRREKGVVLVSLWSFVVLLAANPQWLGLPGQGVLTNFAIFIAAYIPAGILLGYLFGLVARIKDQVRFIHVPLLAILSMLALAGGLWGVKQRQKDMTPDPGMLVTRPDRLAADWIRQNTPEEAVFLVNSFIPYNYTISLGTDAGVWLPLLAGRKTTQPPMVISSEQGFRPDYITWITSITIQLHDKGITASDTLPLLRSHGVTYVYLGQRQGRVTYGEASDPYVIDPGQLLSDSHFSLVYHQDKVWIFKLQD